MGWFYRKPNICKLAGQLQAVESGLRALADAGEHVPSPKDMEALSYMRGRLRELPALADDVEKECWRRVDEYVRTPYTPAQLLHRRFASFFGWWIAATMTLSYSVFGWVVSWFPQPWHMFVASAAVGFVLVALVYLHEWKRR